MKFKGFLCFLICVTLSCVALFSCENTPKDPETRAESFYDYFDTVSVIISYKGDSEDEFKENCDALSSVLSDYHKLFDIYYEYAGINNLRTVNKNAGISPVKVDEKLIDFLVYCKSVYNLTGGKTNIAMGSVLKLWHDEREWGIDEPEDARLPDTEALRAAAEHTDIDSIIIDREAGTVYISDPLLRIDVGAIGKGYATERAAEALIERGVSSYVLNIGGNIRAIGEKPSGTGWSTGITNPDKASDEPFVCRVEIKDISLVTSGDYERFYIVDGERYHHIIDPETLMPANYFTSVSVFCKDGGLADALSTALFCMDYESGRTLCDLLSVEAVWVTADGELLLTDGVELIK